MANTVKPPGTEFPPPIDLVDGGNSVGRRTQHQSVRRPPGRLQPSLITFAIGALLISLVFFIVPIALIVSHTGSVDKSAWQAFFEVVQSRLVIRVFLNTLEISALAAVLSVLLAYPVALHIMRQKARWKIVCLTFVLMPFWTSILVKSYAFMVILGDDGLINHLLRAISLGDGLSLMFNRVSVMIGMTNFLVPYAIFPILASLAAQNPVILAASEMLGASRWRAFWNITFIQSLPGVLAAFLMCLVISMGVFVTPALLGGRKDMMIANVIDMYVREILDWQSASLIALLLLAFCGAISVLLLKLQSRMGG